MTLTLFPNRRGTALDESSVLPCSPPITRPVNPELVAELRRACQELRGGVSLGLTGMDGSGKSTLARQLASVLQSINVPVVVRHWYAWHVNLLRTPRIIARHRQRGAGVCIFDRTLYDNLAGLLARAPRAARIMRFLLRNRTSRLAPLDVCLRVTATWEQSRLRRAGITRESFEKSDQAYQVVTALAGLRVVPSQPDTLEQTLTELLAAVQARNRARRVIFHADDLGGLYAINAGIERAHRGGLLTSTSIRANGPAYRHAVDVVLPACPHLGLGLHLCLTAGKPLAPPASVPLLLDRSGRFRTGFVWLMALAHLPEGKAQIERELRAQIEKVLADGLPIVSIDSYQHVHMIPGIFPIICRLARTNGIHCVRVTREPRHGAGLRRRLQRLLNGGAFRHLLLNAFAWTNRRTLRASALCSPDAFLGVDHAGAMVEDAVTAGLAASGTGSVEVRLQPALGPDIRDIALTSGAPRARNFDPRRRMELHTLTSSRLRHWLRAHGWQAMDQRAACGARLVPPRPARATKPLPPRSPKRTIPPDPRVAAR